MPIDSRSTLCALLGHESSVSDEVLTNSVASFQSDLISFKNSTEAEIERLTNSAATLESSVKSKDSKITALTNSNKTLTEELVNYDMGRFDAVILNKEEIREALLNDRTGTVKTLSALKPGTIAVQHKAPLFNSKTAGVPASAALTTGVLVNGTDSQPDEAQTAKIMNRARELQGTGKMLNYQMAVQAARAEIMGNN